MFDHGWQCCANSVCVEVLTSGILQIMFTKKIYSGDVVQREYYNNITYRCGGNINSMGENV